MRSMIIYHGNAHPTYLYMAKVCCPMLSHGAEYYHKGGRGVYDIRYIIDNGAYKAYMDGTEWDPDNFIEMMEWAEDRPKDPDFVVVPDVVGDSEATFRLSAEWSDRIPWTKYQPVQDGMADKQYAIEFAKSHGSDGIFIGGSMDWKKYTAREWVEKAHESDLYAHIARPWSVSEAWKMGADSVDTTTFVAWGNYNKLMEESVKIESTGFKNE